MARRLRPERLRRLLVLALPLGLTSPSHADALDALLERFAARPAGHAAFTEVHELAMLERALSSSGELRYRAPDYLEKRTLHPRTETLLLDKGRLIIERGGHRREVELAAHPELVPYIESIRATLAGDRAALERYFVVELGADGPSWTLRLTPRAGAAEGSVAEVRMRGVADAIREVQILLKDGDRSRLSIGPELPP